MGEVRKYTKYRRYRSNKSSKDGSISIKIKDAALAEGTKDYCKRHDILVSLFAAEALAAYLSMKLSEEKKTKINEAIDKIAQVCSKETLSEIYRILGNDPKVLERW